MNKLKVLIMGRVMVPLFLFLNSISLFGENIELKYSIGGKGGDQGYSVTNDNNGNIIITGIYSDTFDIDPGIGIVQLLPKGLNDAFIAKFDSSGQFIWGKGISGYQIEFISSVKTDSLNNIILCGYFESTVDFDPGPNLFELTSIGNQDAFLLKLNSDGNFIWAKQFGGKSKDEANALIIGENGIIYVTGSFVDTVYNYISNKLVTNISNGSYDVFLTKYNSNGKLIWAKSFGGKYEDIGNGISVDSKGFIFFIGSFTSKVDFDPGIHLDEHACSLGGPNTFISKFDSQGNYQKVITIGSLGLDHGYSVAIDQNDNMIICGTSSGEMEMVIDSVKSNYMGNGVLLIKFDSLSHLVWLKSFGKSMYNSGNSVVCDINNDIYIIGLFEDSINLDQKNFYSEGGSDVFIAKISAQGDVVWANSFGGKESDEGWSIAAIRPDNIVATGLFYDVGYINNDKNESLKSNGNFDAFYFQMANHPLSVNKILPKNNLVYYPNPFEEKLTILLPKQFINVKIKTIDIMGSTYNLDAFEQFDDSVVIDFSGLPKGLYTLIVEVNENVMQCFKIIHN